MITAVVGIIVLALAVAVVVVIAKDRGPGPVRSRWPTSWRGTASTSSRSTRSRGRSCATASTGAAFIAAKRSAYAQQHELGGLVDRVGVDQVANRRDAAVAITAVELHDHAVVHNRVEMARRNGRWQVVAYRLEPSAEDAPRTDG